VAGRHAVFGDEYNGAVDDEFIHVTLHDEPNGTYAVL
jgi:hypothetical protein